MATKSVHLLARPYDDAGWNRVVLGVLPKFCVAGRLQTDLLRENSAGGNSYEIGNDSGAVQKVFGLLGTKQSYMSGRAAHQHARNRPRETRVGNSRRPYGLVSSCVYYSGPDFLVGAGGRKCARGTAGYTFLASILRFQHDTPEEIPETANRSQGHSAAPHLDSIKFHEKCADQSLLNHNETDVF